MFVVCKEGGFVVTFLVVWVGCWGVFFLCGWRSLVLDTEESELSVF